MIGGDQGLERNLFRSKGPPEFRFSDIFQANAV